MTGQAMYRLSNVRKRLGASFLLHIPQLEIAHGDVLGLLGPTGAGKSTLLRLLTGLKPPTEGEICFDSFRFSSGEVPLATRRRIAMVHQVPLLLRGTVRMNLELGLRLRGSSDRVRQVSEVAERLGLASLMSQSAPTLSGGQRQLVALAQALAIKPEVLLLDEPTAHLDPAHVSLVEETIAWYRQEHSATIVWVTHNLFQARRMTSRAALLLNGMLVETGSTNELLTNPADPRTADFVQGRMVY